MRLRIRQYRQLSKCVVFNLITPSYTHLKSCFEHMEDDGDGEPQGQEDLYTTFAAQAGHSDAIAKHDYGLSNWDMPGVTADQFEDQNEASQRVHIFFGVYGAAVVNVSVNMSATKASIRWKTDQPSGILVCSF